jgi:hypothetical protein
MNAYEHERAECTADEEARADKRLRAWRRRQIIESLAVVGNNDPLQARNRITRARAEQRLRASHRRHVINRAAARGQSLRQLQEIG